MQLLFYQLIIKKRRRWDSNPRSLSESLVFKTSPLNHSGNSPKQCLIILPQNFFCVKHFFITFSTIFLLIFCLSFLILSSEKKHILHVPPLHSSYLPLQVPPHSQPESPLESRMLSSERAALSGQCLQSRLI